MEYTDGSQYYGDWLEGKRNYRGNYILANKNQISGSWLNDEPKGEMEITYINGDHYFGQIHDFKKNDPHGILILSDGTHIVTEFKDDIVNGQVEIKYPNDEMLFDGKYVNNMLEGPSILRFINGNQLFYNFRKNFIEFGEMKFSDGSTFQGKWEEGYFVGKLIEGEEETDGYLCGQTFIKKDSDNYYTENQIRGMFQDQQFFGYQELKQIFQAEVDSIPISKGLKQIIESPCPFSQNGEKVFQTHCLILFPTMFNNKLFTLQNVLPFFNKSEELSSMIGQYYQGSRNPIPMWALIYKDGYLGIPSKVKGQFFEEAKQSIKKNYPNASQYVVPSLLQLSFWILLNEKCENDVYYVDNQETKTELENFNVSFGINLFKIEKKYEKSQHGIHQIRIVYNFKMIPKEVFFDEIFQMKSKFDSEISCIDFNMNKMIIAEINPNILFEISLLNDENFIKDLFLVLSSKMQYLYNKHIQNSEIKLSNQFTNIACICLFYFKIWEDVFSPSSALNFEDKRLQKFIIILFKQLFSLLRKNKMKLLQIFRSFHENSWFCINKSLEIITKNINQYLSADDLIEQAKEEYQELFNQNPPESKTIEAKLKKLLKELCPVASNNTSRIQDTHILLLLPGNINQIEYEKIMEKELNFKLIPYALNKKQFFEKQNYWQNQHQHAYWALIHKHQILSGTREQQINQLINIQKVNKKLFENYQWIGFTEIIAAIFYSLRRSLNQNQTIATFTRNQQQHTYRCSEYNDDYSEEIVVGCFNYQVENSVLVVNPSDWEDNDSFSVMQLFPIKDPKTVCRKCEQQNQFQLYKKFIFKGVTKISMTLGKMNGYGFYSYEKDEEYKNTDFQFYFGDFLNEKRHGKGTMIYKNKTKYEGEWDNNSRQGSGKLIRTDDNLIIQGQWAHDQLQLQQSKIIKEDLTVYEGSINDKYQKNGAGTLITKDQIKYIGIFQEDQLNGDFIVKYEDGKNEMGQFQNNLKEGPWVQEYNNLKTIISYKHNIPETMECQISENQKFVGNFSNGYAIGKIIEVNIQNQVEGFFCNQQFLTKNNFITEDEIRKSLKNQQLFGVQEWKNLCGLNVNSQPIKKEILKILELDCPFSQDKNLKIKDTHCLYLIPSQINDCPFSLEYLFTLLNKEEQNNFKDFSNLIKLKSSKTPTWVLIYNEFSASFNLIPQTVQQSYRSCLQIIDDINEKTGLNYINVDLTDLAVYVILQEKSGKIIPDQGFFTWLGDQLLVLPFNEKEKQTIILSFLFLDLYSGMNILDTYGYKIGVQAAIYFEIQ